LSGFPALSKGVRDVFQSLCSGDEIQAQNVSDRSNTLLGYLFLDCRHKKDSNETVINWGLNKVKSPIGTRDHLVAATCGQFAARRGEGKAKM
jgi:hypothetical protein